MPVGAFPAPACSQPHSHLLFFSPSVLHLHFFIVMVSWVSAWSEGCRCSLPLTLCIFMGFVLLGIGRANPSQEKLCDWVVERAEILLKNSSLLTPLFFCVGLDCKQQNKHQREEGRFLCWNKVAWHEVTVGVQGNTAFKNRHVTKFSPVLFQLLLTVLLVFLFVCFFLKFCFVKFLFRGRVQSIKVLKYVFT